MFGWLCMTCHSFIHLTHTWIIWMLMMLMAIMTITIINLITLIDSFTIWWNLLRDESIIAFDFNYEPCCCESFERAEIAH